MEMSRLTRDGTAEPVSRAASYIIGHSMEVSTGLHGGSWRSPWRSVEVSMQVRGGLHGGPWRSVEVSMELHEGPWRSPWRSVEVSIEVRGGQFQVKMYLFYLF